MGLVGERALSGAGAAVAAVVVVVVVVWSRAAGTVGRGAPGGGLGDSGMDLHGRVNGYPWATRHTESRRAW